jgi:subtilisin family serine protease
MMRGVLRTIVLLLPLTKNSAATEASIGVAAASAADGDPKPRQRRHRKLETRPSREVIPDAYIVIFNDDVVDSPEQVAQEYGIATQHLYHNGVKGFSSPYVEGSILDRLLDDPRVQAIGQDGTLEMEQDDEDAPGRRRAQAVNVQLDAPNHLDSIDQSSSSGVYAYTYTGAGVHVYIVDAGIRATHQDFGGRVASDCFGDIGTCNVDNESHGTHIASLAGGSTYGVAKQVTIHDARIYDNLGIVSWSNLMSGLDYVAGEQLKSSNSTVVVNVSMGGDGYDVVDNAIQKTLDTGAVVVVAAGNQAMNACDRTPARVPGVVTVGATDTSPGVRRSTSNYGPVREKKQTLLFFCGALCFAPLLDSPYTLCLVSIVYLRRCFYFTANVVVNFEIFQCIDIWAPGTNLTAASFQGDTAVKVMSGTSMAAPLVVGAIALYLEAGKTVQDLLNDAEQVPSLIGSDQSTSKFLSTTKLSQSGPTTAEISLAPTPTPVVPAPAPFFTLLPSSGPTVPPVAAPTQSPLTAPSRAPISTPTIAPSLEPTVTRSVSPTLPLSSIPTLTPTEAVLITAPSASPTLVPSVPLPTTTPSPAPQPKLAPLPVVLTPLTIAPTSLVEPKPTSSTIPLTLAPSIPVADPRPSLATPSTTSLTDSPQPDGPFTYVRIPQNDPPRDLHAPKTLFVSSTAITIKATNAAVWIVCCTILWSLRVQQ